MSKCFHEVKRQAINLDWCARWQWLSPGRIRTLFRKSIQTDKAVKTAELDPAAARQKLEYASSPHWFHCVIVLLSLLLTFFAWYYAKSALDARVKLQFDREADQVLELVQERMRKYEDALWGGVALIHTFDGDVDFTHWSQYANSIDVEKKYSGINGIGIIHPMSKEEIPDYLQQQRRLRPEFSVHPSHPARESYPIAYIVPVEGNEQAVGLDIAHETNRFSAAKKSRDSGEAQITGPITLVQDSGKTPGFLFYAPYYQGGTYDNTTERRKHFSSLVYAPFVVKKLMQGVLEKEKRHVGVRLTDQGDVLYDEHINSEMDFDPDPLFKRSVDLTFYGRKWTFDIWSANSFRKASSDSQPFVILAGGIFIDSLLVLLFLSISRASHKALVYADAMTQLLEASEKELKKNQMRLAERAGQLEQSNAELEQFAFVASHDLQEPLRKVNSFCQMLQREYGDKLDDDARTYIGFAVDGALRMKSLITDLLSYSRVKSQGKVLEVTDGAKACNQAIANLGMAIEEAKAQISVGVLPEVTADGSQLVSLFQNLIGNGIKYRSNARAPEIRISMEANASEFVFCVQDNGIGIEPRNFERVFEIFRRLHDREEYSGTGIGLAVCKRIVERFGGRIWVESVASIGSKFYFSLPKIQQTSHAGVTVDAV